LQKLPITAIILTFNEEKNLKNTLLAVSHLTDSILIADSFSTDSTLSIAKEFNCVIVQNKFQNHTSQWKFALENNTFSNEWVIGLDADQVLTNEVIAEIFQIFSNKNSLQGINGFYIKRKMFFLGQWIRFGGYYPLYLLKLFRKESLYLDEGELMEHRFYVNGKTYKLKNPLLENNQNETISFWLQKHIRYAQLQAKEEYGLSKNKKNKGSILGDVNAKKRFLRLNIWEKMPLFLRSFIYFIYRYFILLGFLDGKRGLIFHFLQAFWYRFTVDSLIFEHKSNIKNSK
jgi:glycosyltransferase involved in cell wall biosynthesis